MKEMQPQRHRAHRGALARARGCVPLCLLGCVFILFSAFACTADAVSKLKADGYRGIWFTLGQKSEYGDKYSGGLGTYTANHVPIAIYSHKVNKTFFVYGGTTKGERHLLIMASYYDHATGKVPRPTIVYDKKGVNDPHDNAALAIDDRGRLWVFTSGRARKRPGVIHRSTMPCSTEAFEQVAEREMTYPQPRFMGGRGFFNLMTRYTKGRELYWETSADGKAWETHLLAGFGGHYQVSGMAGDTIGTAFMWHPNGNVDARTNLYYLQTRDFGQTWEALTPSPRDSGERAGERGRVRSTTSTDRSSAERKSTSRSTGNSTRNQPLSPTLSPAYRGEGVKTPLTEPVNDGLLIDYRAQGLNVYIHDLSFDAQERPAILYLTSRGHEPGPKNDPRTWRVTRWTGQAWETSDICNSTHNYDTGCLLIDGDRWNVFGPARAGPQKWGTGGEMQLWSSVDAGRTWRHVRDVTRGSRLNHSYARRVVDGKDPFAVFWADGDADRLSESRLYFSDRAGETVFVLPYDMTQDLVEPQLVNLR